MRQGYPYRWLSLTGMLTISCLMHAQQEWISTQYLFNLYDVNTAYAGNHHALSTGIRHRAQWEGVDGAPQSQLVSMHAPALNGRIGWGMRLQRESIGARSQWMGRASLAYRIPLRDGSFSFALGGGVIRQEMDPASITAQDWNDPQLNGADWTSTSVTWDAACFIHGSRWFAGFEVNRINRGPMAWSSVSDARLFLHGNVIGGRYFKLNEDNLLACTAIARVAEPGIMQAEANLTCLWKNKVWLGAGYRYPSGPVAIAEVNISRQLRLGYSYDLNSGALRDRQDGSHEVFIGYNLKPRDDKSIRQF